MDTAEIVKAYNSLLQTNTLTKKISHIEFEIRFQITSKMIFIGMYEKLSSPTESCTINLIKSTPKNQKIINAYKFVEYTFPGKSTKYFEKNLFNRITNNASIPYTLNVSGENEIRDFIPPADSMIRLKRRVSMVKGNWRIDLTISKHVIQDD